MYKIMFVCLGNICRSPMAECIAAAKLKELGLDGQVRVYSAGTSSEEEGNGIYPPARRRLIEEGIAVLPHSARQLNKYDYDEYDLFLGMETRHVSAMLRIFGGDPQNKVQRLADYSEDPHDIADPWWTGDFYSAYRDIYESCQALIQNLLPMLESGDRSDN